MLRILVVSEICIIDSLYDTNMENMTNAITPSKQKLSRNGVQSVRQRITLLKDFTPLSLEEMKKKLRATICTSSVSLNEKDIEGIKEIEKAYLEPSFIYGK